MRFNTHSSLKDKHAYLSASNSAWQNYDDDKFDRRWKTAQAAIKGTVRHALAAELITHKIRMPDNDETFNRYVNDMIDLRASVEQTLYYSEFCFGHADAIRFEENLKRLYVCDLKTGVIEAAVRQLETYAAMFCLEYHWSPFEMDLIELRIYQNDEVKVWDADPTTIVQIMERIKYCDKRIRQLRLEDDA